MDHTREHRSVLASAEKQLLIAIARRLPPWLSSDHLTLLGLLAMPAAGLAFAAIPVTPWAPHSSPSRSRVNWFGDSLDGTLARVRCQPRPRYGYYVDHVIDLAGTAALVGGHGRVGADDADGRARARWPPTSSCPPKPSSRRIRSASSGCRSPASVRPSCASCSRSAPVFVARNPWATIAGHRALLLDVGGVVATGGLVGVFVHVRGPECARALPAGAAAAAAGRRHGTRRICLRRAVRAARGDGMRSTAAARVRAFRRRRRARLPGADRRARAC